VAPVNPPRPGRELHTGTVGRGPRRHGAPARRRDHAIARQPSPGIHQLRLPCRASSMIRCSIGSLPGGGVRGSGGCRLPRRRRVL